MKTLKYRINEKLEQLPQKLYKLAMIELPQLLDVTPNYFYIIRTIPIESSRGASSDQLTKIAWWINQYEVCSVDDLINKDHIYFEIRNKKQRTTIAK